MSLDILISIILMGIGVSWFLIWRLHKHLAIFWEAVSALHEHIRVGHTQTDAQFIAQDAVLDALIISLETMSDRIALLEDK